MHRSRPHDYSRLLLLPWHNPRATRHATLAHRHGVRRLAALALLLPLVIASAAWPASAPLIRAAAPPAITGLHVVGNQILNGMNQPLRLLGVDRAGTEYACVQGWGIFDGPNDAASVQAIAAWHVNAVRVPLNEDCWLGINGMPAAYSGSAYRQAIASYVSLLNQNGLAAILDLHWTAAGAAPATGQQQMADADHAPAFWTSVAAAFKGNSAVIFDLFNEPFNISWACWRDGGQCTGVPYVVAGMQTLVDAVRGAGATNILMLGGLTWANDLSQWLAYEPHDPLGNLAAAWHVYNFNACNNTGCYDSAIAPLMQRVPLVAGEMGENDCAHGFIGTVMDWLDAHQGSYVAWAWNTASCGSFPALIGDYAGTPTGFGVGLRDHLAALVSGPTPTPGTATPIASGTVPAQPSPTMTATGTARPTATPAATATAATPATTPTATPATLTPTVTPTPSATSTAAATPPSGEIIDVAGSVSGHNGPWWGEDDLMLRNRVPLIALTITITVRQTPGVAYAGAYNTFWAGMLTMDHHGTDSDITYSYSLVAGRTVPAGDGWLAGAQFSGTGTPHATAGDTFVVTATGAGESATVEGHF